METKDIKKGIKLLQDSIAKIDKKENKLMFLVVDTKGTPIGSLSYIYSIALTLKEMGYKVEMLYAEKEFVGVRRWLGDKYADLTHHNVSSDFISVSPEDILFVSDLHSKTMKDLRSLKCKKVAILQHFDYMAELIPFGASWEGMDFHECVTMTERLKTRLNEVFPNIKTHVIRPVIDKVFKKEGKKQLIINIICKDESYIHTVMKPFKWKYPAYGFVSFRYISNKPREEFAKYLSEGEISVWIDPTTDFGYSALEAMACGNVVIGKIPENEPEWMFTPEGKLIDDGIWFYNFRELPDILATVIQQLLHCNIPQALYDNMSVVLDEYTQEKQEEDIKGVIEETIIKERKDELTHICESLKNKLTEEKTEE